MYTKSWSLSLVAVLGFLLFCPCFLNAASSSGSGFEATIEDTTSFIEQGLQEQDIVGLSIALVDKDKIVWNRGFGYADRENRVSATEDTVYMLCSITKTLTAVSVLQLYDQGIIDDLQDPLNKYLPAFEMRERYPDQMQEMTVKSALNHHSGIPGDIMNGGFVSRNWDDWQRGLYSDWLLGYLEQDFPSHRPGEVASYSNTAFTLAGEVVRELSGANTYRDYVQQNLFEPLQMQNSSFRQPQDMAQGYFEGEAICPESEVNITPTGGAYTTARDMAEFIRMILNQGQHPNGERILQPETVELMGEMERTPLDVDSYFQPGLGLDSADDPVMRYAGRAWTKDGGSKNFKSFMEILPDQGLGVIVLSNTDTAHSFNYQVARKCLQNALQEKQGLEPSQPSLPEYESLQNRGDIAGMYVHSGGFDLLQDNGEGGLVWVQNAQSEDPQSLRLRYDGKTRRFAVQDKDFDIVIVNRHWQGEDYTLMLRYGDCGQLAFQAGDSCVRYLGLKTEKSQIPAAWKKRAGKKYIIENIAWNDIYLWNYAYFELKEHAGVLMLSGMLDQPVFPENESTALLRGLMDQREDSSLQAIEEEGREKLVIGGFKAYDADLVPRVQLDDSVSGKTRFPENKWFKLQLDSEPGQLTLDTGNADYTLRVMDGELEQQVAQGQGSLTWDAGTGTWYIAVCPNPDAPREFELQVGTRQ